MTAKTICGNRLCNRPVKHDHCLKCGFACERGRYLVRCPDCFKKYDVRPLDCELCGYDFHNCKSAWRRSEILPGPFTYPGGKAHAPVMDIVLPHFEGCNLYCEPFLGCAAVAINLPYSVKHKFLGDRNGYICNFFRAVKKAPKEVAEWMDWPTNETDMHARHDWLCDQKFLGNLSKPDWCDEQIAGWWAWGQIVSMGDDFCTTANQYGIPDLETSLRRGKLHPDRKTVRPSRCKPIVGGMSPQAREARLARHKPNMGGIGPHELARRIARMKPNDGCICPEELERRLGRKKPSAGPSPEHMAYRLGYMEVISRRLRHARIYCKAIDSMQRMDDWRRLLCRSTFSRARRIAVFLDPPYGSKKRKEYTYGRKDTHESAAQLCAMLRSWCAYHGSDPNMRIAICGYDGEHDALVRDYGWKVEKWTSRRGQRDVDNPNRELERIWLNKPQEFKVR